MIIIQPHDITMDSLHIRVEPSEWRLSPEEVAELERLKREMLDRHAAEIERILIFGPQTATEATVISQSDLDYLYNTLKKPDNDNLVLQCPECEEGEIIHLANESAPMPCPVCGWPEKES